MSSEKIYIFKDNGYFMWGDTNEGKDDTVEYIRSDLINEIKAKAIEDAINECPFYSVETTMETSTITLRINDLRECAEQLRVKK